MDITNVVDKLRNDYHNTQNIINKSVKYSFDYHHSHTDIYYLEENGLKNQILLSICVKDKYYLTTICFSNNDYEINPYIPNEIYQHIKNDIFSMDGYSPVPYFNKLCSVIINKVPIVTDYKDDIKNHNYHIYKDHNECPFFETFTRKNISDNMKEKIYKRYNNDLANKIIKYCYQTGQTLRFTSDFNKAHDIIFAMNNNQH